MPKGKPWTPEEEHQLRQLVDSGDSVNVIAAKMGKTQGAILTKCQRVGLEVVVKHRGTNTTSSELKIPEQLPSVEETLLILAAALKTLEQPGLEKAEVMRLRSIIEGTRIYKELFADYVDYRGIEEKVAQMETKYVRIAKELAEKTKGNARK